MVLPLPTPPLALACPAPLCTDQPTAFSKHQSYFYAPTLSIQIGGLTSRDSHASAQTGHAQPEPDYTPKSVVSDRTLVERTILSCGDISDETTPANLRPEFRAVLSGHLFFGRRLRYRSTSQATDLLVYDNTPHHLGDDHRLGFKETRWVDELVDNHEDSGWLEDRTSRGLLPLLDVISRVNNLRTLCLVGFHQSIDPAFSSDIRRSAANLLNVTHLYLRSVHPTFAQIFLSGARHPQHLSLYSWHIPPLNLPKSGAPSLDLVGTFKNTRQCFHGSFDTLTRLKIGSPFKFPRIPVEVLFPALRHIIFHLKNTLTADARLISLLAACQNLQESDVLSGHSAKLLLPHLPLTLISFSGQIHKTPSEIYTAA